MITFDAIEERRAVKHYDENHSMSEAEINKLLTLAIQSPTSFNIQHWRFVVVQDADLKEKIKKAAWGQAQITDASLLIVLCADIKAWEKSPERYWKDAPSEAREKLLPMIQSFYEGKEELQRDEAIRSCGIAAQTIMLSAKAMGYDSCPMIGFNPQEVAEIIDLPKDHLISMLISVGKSTKEAWPKPGQLKLEEVVIKDKF
ncbi:MAG TPA: nitroreductase family protein [Vampirovibrionales bacterium]